MNIGATSEDPSAARRSSGTTVNVLAVGFLPPPFNGMSVATQHLVQGLDDDLIEIALVDIGDRRGLSNVGRLDVTNLVLAIVHGARFMVRLVRRKPDVIYVPIAQNALGFLRDALFLLPAKVSGCPVVIHLHGGYFGRFYEDAAWWLKALIRWLLRDVSGIVLAESLRPALARVVNPSRTAVVPNGIDPAPYLDSDKGPPRGNRVAFLSTLMRTKGVFDVLEAVPLVRAEVPDVAFTLAGEWYSREDARHADACLRRHALAEAVQLPGVVTGRAKVELLCRTHVFVFPTTYPYEGQPYVVLEAMAAGLPIVTTAQGAIPEMVTDKVNGFIVPHNDPQAVADATIALLKDDELRARMGEASRQRILTEYTLDRWVSDMERALQDAARHHGQG